MELKDVLKLDPTQSLKRTSYRTKGSMAEKDLYEYDVLDSDGSCVGKVLHVDEVTRQGVNRQYVKHTDSNGEVILEQNW